MQNNKQMGNQFEIELCELFKQHGWWITRLNPDGGGNQPADLIAVRNNTPVLIDAKVCSGDYFPLSRVEDNQDEAMAYWESLGNHYVYFAMKLSDGIYMIDYDLVRYSFLMESKKISGEQIRNFPIEVWFENMRRR